MRLNINDLRQIFISNIKENIPVIGMECPSPKEMLQLFRSKKIEKKKTKIIDHITNCYHCALEFEFILKALRLEKDMNHVAEKLIATKSIKHVPPRISWRFGSVVGGILIICTLTSVVIISRALKSTKYRASAFTQIALLLPQSTSVHKSDLSFEWEKVRESEYYIFELYDEALYQFWRSNRIFGNNFTLPENIISCLEAKKTYFWMISAIFTNGTKLESRLKEIFFIE